MYGKHTSKPFRAEGIRIKQFLTIQGILGSGTKERQPEMFRSMKITSRKKKLVGRINTTGKKSKCCYSRVISG